jgi:hypothetical protein
LTEKKKEKKKKKKNSKFFKKVQVLSKSMAEPMDTSPDMEDPKSKRRPFR